MGFERIDHLAGAELQHDVQHAVEEVLAIEREAVLIIERAKEEARRLRSEGAKAADSARQTIISEARRSADNIVAAAKDRAEAERARIMADNERDLEELQREAEQRMDTAIQLVIDWVSGAPL